AGRVPRRRHSCCPRRDSPDRQSERKSCRLGGGPARKKMEACESFSQFPGAGGGRTDGSATTSMSARNPNQLLGCQVTQTNPWMEVLDKRAGGCSNPRWSLPGIACRG